MANGDRCVHCDLQETQHDHPYYAPEGVSPCGMFESPVKHEKECPIIGCNGDCQETLAERAWKAQVAENRLRNSWYMDPRTGNIVLVDMSD
ncbi:MAG: hypothetical protein JWL87_343 [Candidatus Adlerbacteria bacterium]|nr:hypothetical protein [Candidatus Adlerbacteria bacterium]